MNEEQRAEDVMAKCKSILSIFSDYREMTSSAASIAILKQAWGELRELLGSASMKAEMTSTVDIEGESYPVYPQVAALFQAVSEERDELKAEMEKEIREAVEFGVLWGETCGRLDTKFAQAYYDRALASFLTHRKDSK